jgi:hypothetical protein
MTFQVVSRQKIQERNNKKNSDNILKINPARQNKFIQTKPVCPCGGGCPRCNIQAKLKVSQPGDIYEQEADKIADQVMRMPSDQISRKCSGCEMKDDEEMKIHRKSDDIGGLEASDDIASDINSIKGGGSPLDIITRDFMESKFGFDFSKVRIHTDEKAAKSAESVNARAYAVGNDIVFGRGEYSPQTISGQHLIVHELVHVMQEGSVSQEKLMRYEAGEHAKFGAMEGEEEKKIIINGVEMKYGEMIAMGDFFEKPEDVSKAKKTELESLLVLIQRERDKGIGSVKEEEWIQATGGRYLELAGKNEAHFASADEEKFKVGEQSNKGQWFEYHIKALKLAQNKKMNEALQIDAFGDHFLTDAFSAGHLINKQKLIESAKGHTEKDFQKFQVDVADGILKDPAAARLFEYEANPGALKSWAPMSPKSLGDVIGRIRYWKADQFYSIFAKAVHDKLNRDILPGGGGGIEVKNKKGNKWRLSGDKTLSESPETLKIAREAVSMSRKNIENAQGEKNLDYMKLAQSIWDYVPHPTNAGQKIIDDDRSTLTDPTQKATVDAFVKITLDNFDAVLEQLVKEGMLRLKKKK